MNHCHSMSHIKTRGKPHHAYKRGKQNPRSQKNTPVDADRRRVGRVLDGVGKRGAEPRETKVGRHLPVQREARSKSRVSRSVRGREACTRIWLSRGTLLVGCRSLPVKVTKAAAVTRQGRTLNERTRALSRKSKQLCFSAENHHPKSVTDPWWRRVLSWNRAVPNGVADQSEVGSFGRGWGDLGGEV